MRLNNGVAGRMRLGRSALALVMIEPIAGRWGRFPCKSPAGMMKEQVKEMMKEQGERDDERDDEGDDERTG